MAGPKALNFHARPWTPEEDAVLLRCVRSASTPWEGLKAASAALGRSLSGCKNRFYHLTGESLASSPANRELHRLARVKGRLNAPDIERVARATGIHYHSALAALASLHARGAVSDTCPGCSDLQMRDKEVARLGAEVARLEQLLQEANHEAEALRARVADMEAKLGVGLDPLAGELSYWQEGVALGMRVVTRDDLKRRGALLRDDLSELIGRFGVARCQLEHAVVDACAGEAKALAKIRKQQAFLNACIESLMAKFSENQKVSQKTSKEAV